MMVGRPVELVVDKEPSRTRRGGARVDGAHRARPVRPIAGRPCQLPGACRRDRRHRRRAGQRPDRARRAAGRARGGGRRPHPSDGRRHHRRQPARDAPTRRRPHPRGPPARGHGQGLLGHREPGAHATTPAPLSKGIIIDWRSAELEARAAGRGVRHPHAVDADHRRHAVGRQPAEGDRRSRAQPRRSSSPSPANPPAASTSARSSTSTSASWPCATRVSPCSSSAPSSTR